MSVYFYFSLSTQLFAFGFFLYSICLLICVFLPEQQQRKSRKRAARNAHTNTKHIVRHACAQVSKISRLQNFDLSDVMSERRGGSSAVSRNVASFFNRLLGFVNLSSKSSSASTLASGGGGGGGEQNSEQRSPLLNKYFCHLLLLLLLLLFLLFHRFWIVCSLSLNIFFLSYS